MNNDFPETQSDEPKDNRCLWDKIFGINKPILPKPRKNIRFSNDLPETPKD